MSPYKYLSYDGVGLKTEASSNFQHYLTFSLGIYKNSIFATGHFSSINGLKTEKLEIGSRTWIELDDYQSIDSSQDRFVYLTFYWRWWPTFDLKVWIWG